VGIPRIAAENNPADVADGRHVDIGGRSADIDDAVDIDRQAAATTLLTAGTLSSPASLLHRAPH